jgi:endonuclease/exonuclease/phosphatase family metal-dependent hydrolase
VYEELLRVFEPFEIATAGELSGAPGLSIDHIAHTADLLRGSAGLWQRRTVDDQPLSDHFGVWCDLRPTGTATRRFFSPT